MKRIPLIPLAITGFFVGLTTVIFIARPAIKAKLITPIKSLTEFKLPWSNQFIQSPFVTKQNIQDKPLIKYSIKNLKKYSFQASQIQAQEYLDESESHWSLTFSYQTTGKKMSGVLNFPKQDSSKSAISISMPVIILIRGWVPAENYYPGLGTKNAAAYFAKQGYITLAPDFFGYETSDDEPDSSWEARFVKPVNIIELIKSIQQNPKIKIETEEISTEINLNSEQIGIWSHSNGGQIALSTLEITSKPIPTTLWAPVTAPFPYSILFFSDEHADEGKQMRAWLAKFEQDYDILDYSLTQHLDFLTGPFQIHHGTADEAALKTWSDEFVQKLEAENKRRQKELQNKTSSNLKKIEFDYYIYPGADHNLRPNWSKAMARDLEFFNYHLK